MTQPRALYVEIDPYCAAWLKNLIRRDVIAPGDVHCGDVRDCRPKDLARYNQVHLYAGVGVWSYGLRRAGVADSASIWTFSEPCQPFSAAGKRLGFADERYLRPCTHHLIEQCRPAICLGEQVASNDGLAWLDVVQTDMERANYAGGAEDTCSAGFGAPHIRQRLRLCYADENWLADAYQRTCGQGCTIGTGRANRSDAQPWSGSGGGGVSSILADSHDARLEGWGGMPGCADQCAIGPLGMVGRLGIADSTGLQPWRPTSEATGHGRSIDTTSRALPQPGSAGPTNGFWNDADWLYCRDGKWRPVEPGTFPLAHGASSRVGRLRAYGNAVDAEATTEFCRDVAHTLGL